MSIKFKLFLSILYGIPAPHVMPVMATVAFTGIPVSKETIEEHIATPAEGPLLSQNLAFLPNLFYFPEV